MIRYKIQNNYLTKKPTFSAQTYPVDTLGIKEISRYINLHNPTIPQQTAIDVLELMFQEILYQLSVGNWINLNGFCSIRATIKARLAGANDPLPAESIDCVVIPSKTFADKLRTSSGYDRTEYKTKKPSILSIIDTGTGLQNFVQSNVALNINGTNLQYDPLTQEEGVFIQKGTEPQVKIENVSINDPSTQIVTPDLSGLPGVNYPDYWITVKTRYTVNGSLRTSRYKKPLRPRKIIADESYIMNVGQTSGGPVRILGYTGDLSEMVFFAFMKNNEVRLGVTTIEGYSTNTTTHIYRESGPYTLYGLDQVVNVQVERDYLRDNIAFYGGFIQEVCSTKLFITTFPFAMQLDSTAQVDSTGGSFPLTWVITGDPTALVYFSNGQRTITINDSRSVDVILDSGNPYDGSMEITVNDSYSSDSISFGVQAVANTALPISTGQTVCYDASGNPVSCVGSGQDGEYQAGVSMPSPRFTDNTDGTLTDNLTGLIWCKMGAVAASVNFADAVSNAALASDGLYGLSDGSVPGDWRVPNINELWSLFNYDYSPSITNIEGNDSNGASGTASFDVQNNQLIWSSTTSSPSATNQLLTMYPVNGRSYENTQSSNRDLFIVKNTSSTVLLQTGANICYDLAGLPKSCVGSGQDAEFQAGVEIPNPRFEDNGDGTITDLLTGLIWNQSASIGTLEWPTALSTANATPGFKIPSLHELRSLLDYSRSSPMIDNSLGLFTNLNTGAYTWTSTSSRYAPANTFVIDTSNGELLEYGKTAVTAATWLLKEY